MKMFNILKYKPQILILSETKYDINYNINNYDLIKINNPKNNKHGITMFCLKNIRKNILRCWCDNKNDIILCEFPTTFIISGYCPPNSVKNKTKQIEFWKNLNKIIENLKTDKQVILIGDFNARLGLLTGDKIEPKNINTINIQKIINKNKLKILNTIKHYGKPTFMRNHGKSIIDLILVPKIKNMDMQILNNNIYNNDHFPILCDIKTNKPLKDYSNCYNINFKKQNEFKTNTILKKLKWLTIKKEKNIDNFGIYFLYEIWNELIEDNNLINSIRTKWRPCSKEIAELFLKTENSIDQKTKDNILNNIRNLEQEATNKYLKNLLDQLLKLPY
jgi:hypothetical protein